MYAGQFSSCIPPDSQRARNFTVPRSARLTSRRSSTIASVLFLQIEEPFELPNVLDLEAAA
jgi:hypothetical protein